MSEQTIPGGTVHKLPSDLRQLLGQHQRALKAWHDITPLARNEWICWIESPKQEATRLRRLNRAKQEIEEGERRPCCWIGCIHRTDKAISPSVQAILNRQTSK